MSIFDELISIVLGKISHLILGEHGTLVSCNGLKNLKYVNDLFLDKLDYIFLLCFLQPI